ncbi:MAG: hypothetical protein ACREL7_05430 [Longimicrobiales bacterium]
MEELIPITMFMCIAAVAILRPISTKVGGLLEAITRERSQSQAENSELARLRVLMEHVAKRLEIMEERLDFTERLIANNRPASHPTTPRLDRPDSSRHRDQFLQP